MDGHGAQTRLAANATLWGAATALSRLLGFARDLGIAVLLGAGPMSEAFFLAFRIPDFLRRSFGEGVWSMAFVPAFMARSNALHNGRESGFALARSVMAWLALLAGGGSLALLLAGPWLLRFLAPDLEGTQLAATVELLRICSPYVLFVLCAALSVALLNALGCFFAPALAPAIFNCSILLGVILAWAAGASAETTARTLAWAVLLGGFAQWLAQQPALRAAGFSWRGPWRLRDPDALRLGREALPVLLGVSCFQATGVLATLLAASLSSGSVAWIYYAERLAQLPLGLFSVAVSVAALPELAALAAMDKGEEFSTLLRQGLGLALWCSLPAAAGLAALGPEVVGLLFGHGAFDQTAVAGTGATVAALALGLPALASVRPLAAACNARQEPGATVAAAAGGLACFALAAWPCMRLFGAPGLGLAMSLAGWGNAGLLLFALKRQGVRLWHDECLRPAAVTLGLSLAVYGLARLGLELSAGAHSLAVLLLTPGLAVGYVLASRTLGLPAALVLLRALARRPRNADRSE